MVLEGNELKKYFLLLLMSSAIIACGEDFQYIQPSEFKGITLESHSGVYKVAIKIKGEATCSSQIKFYLSGELWIIPVKNSVDTLLTRDWYDEPLAFKVELDSCIVENPVIGIKFID